MEKIRSDSVLQLAEESDGEEEGENKKKRKYAKGGRAKLKTVSTILEAHLKEMISTSESERHEFYAKMAALPAIVAAGVTRDEVLHWYKRARKKTRVIALKAEKAVGYTLYSCTTCKGKAKLIRLLFVVAGVNMTENNMDNMESMGLLGNGFPYPAKEPPIVTGPDGYNASHTPVIISSLGKQFGLYPNGKDETHCMALSTIAIEYAHEAESVSGMHPLSSGGAWETVSSDRTTHFVTQRLPSFLAHFEHCLSVAQDKAFLFSARLTYCDVVVLHALITTEMLFPEEFSAMPIPLLAAFKTRMEALDRVHTFLSSFTLSRL
mmetsp:Transcript_11025/g.14339  ORF Transcript_11025/g.14339 Transcript_11025/m.14339 type:complete len:321 (+) Transcript_11025:49-1011(+)